MNRSVWTFSLLLPLVALRQAEAAPILFWNPGFETAEATAGVSSNGLPTTFADWAGDESAIVTAENGITPLNGSQMLHFISNVNPMANWGIASDIWQLVDMSPYATDIAFGRARATWSAHFNRVSGNSETEPQFYISVRAFAGLPDAFPLVAEHPLAGINTFLLSDADPATWEPISASLLLPIGTTYIGLRLAARETLNDSPAGSEFAGHYADRTALSITTVPEPASLVLVSSGLAVLAARLRKKGSEREFVKVPGFMRLS